MASFNPMHKCARWEPVLFHWASTKKCMYHVQRTNLLRKMYLIIHLKWNTEQEVEKKRIAGIGIEKNKRLNHHFCLLIFLFHLKI